MATTSTSPVLFARCRRLPEVDRADFFDMETAKVKINAAQAELLDEAERLS